MYKQVLRIIIRRDRKELLPEKSKKRYVRERSLFLAWCQQKNYEKVTENVLLTYFTEKATTMKSSSLWSAYSMLKTTLVLQDNIDISKYPKLLAFLKHKAVGYKARKSQIFTGEDIHKFLQEAPDEVYLMMKVILIMGVAGACRRDELMRMTIDDIEDKDTVLIITIPDSKTLALRSFVITSQTENWLTTYRKYFNLRPSNVEHRRFFLHYNNGKCSTQPVGINTFGKVPPKIAEYLKLPNPSQYTGHCFRKTNAKLIARF